MAISDTSKAGRRTSGQRGTPAAEDPGAGRWAPSHDAGATVTLPFVTARFHMPTLYGPRQVGQEVGAALQGVRNLLPSRNRALYFGGLAALTVFQVIEWPVAAAIGVGTALATNSRNRHDARNGHAAGGVNGESPSLITEKNSGKPVA
jgi:hypothetical protein